MSEQATIPAERIQMPHTVIVCEPMRFLQIQGLPPGLKWSYPPRSPLATRYSVDFSLLKKPEAVQNLLVDAGVPDWYILGHDWTEYLAIGTWTTIDSPRSSMMWKICVDAKRGTLFRVETDPVQIEGVLQTQQDLASGIGTPLAGSQLVSLAISECITFINSSPQQMMECFKEYFTFVNNRNVSAEDFLRSVRTIDRPASDSGAMWYLLVADYLNQDEY